MIFWDGWRGCARLWEIIRVLLGEGGFVAVSRTASQVLWKGGGETVEGGVVCLSDAGWICHCVVRENEDRWNRKGGGVDEKVYRILKSRLNHMIVTPIPKSGICPKLRHKRAQENSAIHHPEMHRLHKISNTTQHIHPKTFQTPSSNPTASLPRLYSFPPQSHASARYSGTPDQASSAKQNSTQIPASPC